MTERQPRRAVALLAAQAFAFGLSESLLLIAANALFLGAYGSKWLPLTYVAIAVFGTLVAAWIARTVRRWPLPRVAIFAEAAVALLFLAAWAILAGGGVWVSAPLLVLFPVLLQIGFVFVGGQAGRLLDVQQLKTGFPRIVSGFAIGFLVGGLVGAPLLSLFGSTHDLLLVAVGAQVVFVVLIGLADGWFGDRLRHVEARPAGLPRPSLRWLLSTRFVVLLIAYQFLSAAGTYMVEFLLFDRASARYPETGDLASFLSKFTVVLNVVDILFLALLAGALLRRYGLRLGIAANPAVVTALAAAMLVAAVVSGSAALSVFVLVAAARVADVSLTDGTTRTSVNTAFQLLPVEERVAVQATVEGIGVPVAIGATGVLLFALRVFGVPTSGIVGVTVGVCAVWTATAVWLYRDYARALAAALRRRLLPDDALDPQHPATAASLHGLLASEDGRDVRLGLDLLPGMWAAGARDELSRLAADPRPDVRLSALARLAREGDADARDRLGEEVAAHVRDPDPSVRAEALAAVTATDTALVGEVVAALDDPETAGAAVEALGRLGDAVLPVVTAALAEAGEPVPPRTLRLVRAVRSASPENAAACLAGHVAHPDRELGLAVLSALAATRVDAVSHEATLDQTLREDAEHAARCLATLAALEPSPVLERALRDELDLLRDRVLALLAVLHGAETIDAVALGLRDEGERRSLAVEMLEVALDRDEAALALPVVRTDLPDAERLSLLKGVLDAGRPATLSGLVEDDEGCWRSEWLRACAAYELRTARSIAGSIGA